MHQDACGSLANALNKHFFEEKNGHYLGFWDKKGISRRFRISRSNAKSVHVFTFNSGPQIYVFIWIFHPWETLSLSYRYHLKVLKDLWIYG